MMVNCYRGRIVGLVGLVCSRQNFHKIYTHIIFYNFCLPFVDFLVKSGGPLETIVDSETGFLCESQPADFSKVMMKFLVDPSLRDRMGEAGCERVRDNFSFSAFSEKLETIVAHLYRN